MGADGGSIPTRVELVKTKKKAETADKKALEQVHWRVCAISKEPLHPPMVADAMGRMYNKDAVISFLLNRKLGTTLMGDADQVCAHIGSMKHVVTLNLTDNPQYAQKQDAQQPSSAIVGNTTIETVDVAPFICPISFKEMNGKHKFIYVATCGCVMSEQALKQVPTSTCLVCNKPFSFEQDVVVLNPSQTEDIQRMEARMKLLYAEIASQEAHKKAEKKLKKKKKSKKRVEEGSDVGSSDSETERKRKKPGMTKVQVEQQLHLERRANINVNLPKMDSVAAISTKLAKSDAIASLYKADPVKKEKSNWLTMGTFNRYAP